jgi:site-specific DNA-methyltransferase (adenine-specific)
LIFLEHSELADDARIPVDALVRADCLDVLHMIEPGSVALVLADPPFGKLTRNAKWDQPIDLEKLWPLLWRALRPNGAAVIHADQPFASFLIQSQLRHYKYEWVWQKSSSTGFLNSKKRPLSAHELLQVFYRTQPYFDPQKTKGPPNHSRGAGSIGRAASHKLYGKAHYTPSDESGMKYPRTVVNFAKHTSRERLHTAQKPVEMLRYFIRTYTRPGDVVLDYAVGSGSTCEAAYLEGRRFIGIELDEEAFAKAVARLEALPAKLAQVAL